MARDRAASLGPSAGSLFSILPGQAHAALCHFFREAVPDSPDQMRTTCCPLMTPVATCPFSLSLYLCPTLLPGPLHLACEPC